jgi:hypothetical protein
MASTKKVVSRKSESESTSPTNKPVDIKPSIVPPPEASATSTPAYDPFDPANIKLDQNFAESAGLKKLLTTVPVRKPKKQEFNRVRPEPEYRSTAAVIELEEDRETYLIAPEIARTLPDEISAVTIFTAINRQGVLFLWPVKLPSPDRKPNDYNRTAREGAELCMTGWYKVKANTSLGAYEHTPGAKTIPDPEWPDLPFRELLRIAFRDRYIDHLEHPVIQRLLRGS